MGQLGFAWFVLPSAALADCGGFINMHRLDDYIAWKSIRSPRAAKIYPNWIKKFFVPIGKVAEEVTTTDLASFKNWLEDHNYKSGSICLAFSILKNYFKYLKLRGFTVMDLDLITVPKCHNDSPPYLTLEEYEKLLKAIPPTGFDSLQRNLAIRLLFETGIRVSELCSLNISQIDPKENWCYIGNRKNTDSRIIVWSMSTHDFLRMRFLPIRKAIAGSDALFIGHFKFKQWSKRLSTRSVERWIREVEQKANLGKPIVPHSFRHSWGIHHLKDFDLEFIRRGLGHKNLESTKIYLQRNNPDFIEEANKYFKKLA